MKKILCKLDLKHRWVYNTPAWLDDEPFTRRCKRCGKRQQAMVTAFYPDEVHWYKLTEEER